MQRDQCSKSHFVLLFERIRLTFTRKILDYVTSPTSRMFCIHQLVLVISILTLTNGNSIFKGETSKLQLEKIQSPMLEVLMHFPENSHDVRSFKTSLGLKPEKTKRKLENNFKSKRIVDVRSYEITQPVSFVPNTAQALKRTRRDAQTSDPTKNQPILEKPEPEKLVSKPLEFGGKYEEKASGPILPIPERIRGPVFTTYPVKEFDVVDIDDPNDPRRRRNDSYDNGDDNSQRDKRTFMEGGVESGETTTTIPFWKRKKENPPFVTGRGGSIPKDGGYTPPQHRSGESARESHSIKNLDKTVLSNEISRANPDNYYASTNRRTYSRQSDSGSPSTPKSVYDIIDYRSKKNIDGGRTDFGRNHDEKKETIRDGRPTTHEQYIRQQPFSQSLAYDRFYYQPSYPYPPEVIGRGIEYYHRTYDPSNGRIIYYANMPEPGRSYDYRYMDPLSRHFYVNNRPYFYDPYYRNYVLPYDYRFPSGFGRGMDYMRTGRSGSQAYSYPYQDREKFSMDAKFYGNFEKGNRMREDLRNKTYVIYDADETRSQFTGRNQPFLEGNRSGYPLVPNNLPPPQMPYPLSAPVEYFPQGVVFNRNQFYSSPKPQWNLNQRPLPGITDSNGNSRRVNSPKVQLSLTTSSRNLHSSGDLEKAKKS